MPAGWTVAVTLSLAGQHGVDGRDSDPGQMALDVAYDRAGVDHLIWSTSGCSIPGGINGRRRLHAAPGGVGLDGLDGARLQTLICCLKEPGLPH